MDARAVERDTQELARRIADLGRDALCDAAPGWGPHERLERDDLGPLPRVNVSIKPTRGRRSRCAW